MENVEKTENKPKAFPGAFDLFKPSVEILKNNATAFLILIGIPLLLLLMSMGSDMFKPGGGGMYSDSGNSTLANIGLLGLILSLIATPAVIMLQIKGAHKEIGTYTEALKNGMKHVLPLLGLSIVLTFILFASLIALIVPFFIVLPRVLMAPYYLVDQKLGVFASISASFKQSKGYLGPIWGLIGVSILLGLVSVLPVVGIVASAALSVAYSAAFALRYLHIKASEAGKNPITPIELEVQKAQKA